MTEHIGRIEWTGAGEPTTDAERTWRVGQAETGNHTGHTTSPGYDELEPVDQPERTARSEVEAAGTGHPAVDAAVRSVAAATDAPPADQVPAYQALHRTLRETLTSIDQD